MLLNAGLLARQLAATLRPKLYPTLRLGGRRIRFLVVFSVVFPLLWLTATVGMWLDNLLYPRHRKDDGKFPVFIIGNFRTGSTFLYRLLARDERTFTCTRTWELYFAPSVTQRRFWKGVFAVDALFGGPILRTLRDREERLLGEVQLHRVRLEEPEEDEALFCYVWHTFFTVFFFPAVVPGFPYPRFDQALPASTRRRILAFYRGCIRRHRYAHGGRAHYLSKNPSATSKISSLLEAFPDARFICLYRDPLEAVPSTMRWFSFAWHYFSSARERYPLGEFIQTLMDHWYRYPLERADTDAAGRIQFVSYEGLVSDPEATVTGIYETLGLAMDPGYRDVLRREAELSRNHRPDGTGDLTDTGLTTQGILDRYRGIPEAYERRFGFGSRPQDQRRRQLDAKHHR